MVCIHDIRYVILSTLFPLFMSNQACTAVESMPYSTTVRPAHATVGIYEKKVPTFFVLWPWSHVLALHAWCAMRWRVDEFYNCQSVESAVSHAVQRRLAAQCVECAQCTQCLQTAEL